MTKTLIAPVATIDMTAHADVPASQPLFGRDADGLIKNMIYVRKSDNRIDWRAMINPAHIVRNEQQIKRDEVKLIQRYSKPVAEIETKNLDDRYLLILLAGIKELAHLRGYMSVAPRVAYASDSRCVVETLIMWIPNFETSGYSVAFGDVGSATPASVGQGFDLYLEPIAANRAFVRAVRNFLGIHIVGRDEVPFSAAVSPDEGGTSTATNDSLAPSISSPQGTLKKAADDAKLTFTQVKETVIAKYRAKMDSDPALWERWQDVKASDCLTIIDILRSRK